MDDSLLALLRQVDTPTVCNAIEVAQGRRGFAGFTRGTVLCSAPGEAMVGYAVTAKLAALEPPREDPAAIRARRMAYYRAMWEAPKPAVAVIEDLDDVPIGAFWGEVNTNLHKALGVAGALTNGVMRDLGDLAPDFPVVAGSVGPSHGFVHLREVGTPVTVFGLTIEPSDLVHADRHGAVVIPPEVLPQLAAAIERLWASERVILDPSRRGFAAWSEFEAAWAAFERARV
jgi:regulator of RNase E activity RraA